MESGNQPSLCATYATGPTCKYVRSGSHAGLYSPRREYQRTLTQQGTPGATSVGNST
jgi:hypothetical protein